MSRSTNTNASFLFRLAFLSFLITIFVNFFTLLPKSKKPQVNQNSQKSEEVLGLTGSRKPIIYISGRNNRYSSGGLIPIASTDDPVVDIDSTTKGLAKFELFEADKEALFSYLIYEEENQQVNPQMDTSGFEKITSFEKQIGAEDKVSLPLKDTGMYYLPLQIQSWILI